MPRQNVTLTLVLFLFPEPKSNRDFGYCEAGFSAEYMKDPPYSVIFGAVGSKQWTGRRVKAFYFQNHATVAHLVVHRAVRGRS